MQLFLLLLRCVFLCFNREVYGLPMRPDRLRFSFNTGEILDIPIRCNCGHLQGVVLNAPKESGPRAICLCDDCQSFAHFLGRAKLILDANGGTEVLPVAPANFKITKGIDQLKLMRLSPKGLLRWYAGCCQTAIGNSPPSPRFPFIGLIHTIFDRTMTEKSRDEAMGPVHTRMLGKYGIAPLPEGTPMGVPLPLMARTLPFFLKGLLKGSHKPSPLFDPKTGLPIREAYVLTREERDKIRLLCGPK